MKIISKKNIICSLMLSFTFAGINAQENAGVPDLSSPDGRLVVSFNLTGTENPTYSVKYDGKQMLEDSPIGIMLDMGSKPTLEGLPQGREAGNGDFTKNLTLVGTLTDMGTVDYTMDRIKTAHVSHEYSLAVFQLQNEARQNIEFEFRVSNNDIAIRYNIPKPRQRASTRVLFENTGFRLHIPRSVPCRRQRLGSFVRDRCKQQLLRFTSGRLQGQYLQDRVPHAR